MPFIPAVCAACHTVFSSGIYARNIDVNLSGYKAEPCPNCRSEGYVRGGLYKFISYTLSILEAEERTLFELSTLHSALLLAQDDGLLPEHLEVIIKYDLPAFLDLLLLLPQAKKDYKLCLTLITQVIFAVTEISIQVDKVSTRSGRYLQIHQDLKVNQVIEQIYTNNTGVEKRLF